MNKLMKSMMMMCALMLLMIGIAQPATAKAATLQDGTYTLPFTVLHASKDQPSKMNDYFVSPGTLKVKDGKKFVSFKVKSSNLVTAIQFERNGVMVDATVLSTNTAENTRVVEFEVGDLSTLLKGKVTIKIPVINYYSTYDIRMSFDTSNIQ
ncbi:NEAT domain-containing protein [Priestia taiwanensis]|uniref:Cell surface protein n=1 Tax=Priestia taiwanensis TaxID=1347902 RepID=A0A917ARU3_9BACI|nr:NEAT domain-containing protein [Priestia taiwanensis]MBM7363271.1 heme-binding NEAT domain protein [Priestia taiwanensis]GGE69050.1 cell surface protein [Priestia taiwanensis]